MSTPAKNAQPSRLKQYVTNMARKQNLAMFDTLKRSGTSELKPRLTIGKLMAYTYAALYYIIGLAIAVYIAYYVLYYQFAICYSFIGIFVILLVFAVRPRFGKFPKKYFTAADVPTLYKLIDDIAQQYGIGSIDGVIFDNDFNAAFSTLGLRRRSLLIIGLPLWNVMTGQEKVAILAHELAHAAHGDARRTFLVKSVCDSLIELAKILYPMRMRGPLAFIYTPWVLLMRGLSGFALWNARFVYYLLSRESQRAEYLADYLSSTLTGTQAARSALGKTYFARVLPKIRRNSLRANVAFDPTAFYEEVRNTSLDELEKINEPDPDEIAQLYLSHPPIGYRMQFLEAKPITQPQIELSAESSDAIDAEIGVALQKYRPVRFSDDEFWKNLPKKSVLNKPK